MDRYQFLILIGCCLLITLPLEFVIGTRVYRRPTRLILTLIPVLVVFSLWSIAGVVRGHWSYNQDFIVGIRPIEQTPLEAFVFVLVVPICVLCIYEATGIVMMAHRERRALRFPGGGGNA